MLDLADPSYPGAPEQAVFDAIYSDSPKQQVKDLGLYLSDQGRRRIEVWDSTYGCSLSEIASLTRRTHIPVSTCVSSSQCVAGYRRRQSDATISPPGLHLLVRKCPSPDPSFVTTRLEITPSGQRVAHFASVPLTSKAWRPLGEGEIVVVKKASQPPCT